MWGALLLLRGATALGCDERPVAPSPPASSAPAGADLPSAATPLPSAPIPGSAASAAPIAPAPKRYVVAAIGDSLTDTRGGGGKYLELLRERCPQSRFDNFGTGGHMVNQMRRRVENEVLPDPPEGTAGAAAPEGTIYTDLLVFGGVNDLYSDQTANRTFEKITGDLAAMYERGHARGARVIAITVAPWAGLERYFNDKRSADTLRLNDWLRDGKGAGRVEVVVDAYPILSCGEPERLCKDYAQVDGVHLNAEGHRVLGEAVYAAAYANCL